MKFTLIEEHEDNNIYYEGDFKVIKKFLFLPKSFKIIKNKTTDTEIRWFETVHILQRCNYAWSKEYKHKHKDEWKDESFIDLKPNTNYKTLNEMLISTNHSDQELAYGIIGKRWSNAYSHILSRKDDIDDDLESLNN